MNWNPMTKDINSTPTSFWQNFNFPSYQTLGSSAKESLSLNAFSFLCLLTIMVEISERETLVEKQWKHKEIQELREKLSVTHF